ncbi:hypothetical protein FOZ63_025176, partial [Perkinsus olseni]
DAEIVFVEYIRVGWKSRECGVGTWMLSSFLKHVKNERPKLDAVYLMVGKEHIARRMYENVGFTQLKGTNRSALAYYQYPYTNAAAAAASAAAPAAAPDEHSPTESVNPEEALPGEVSPVVCPGLISNCFIAVNTTNNSNTMVGYIRYLVIQGKNLPGLRRRMKIPTIKEDGEILYVGHVEVLQSSQNHGVATWLLHNFLAHLKKKRPEVEAVYLVVEPDNWIARRVYENNGFERTIGRIVYTVLPGDRAQEEFDFLPQIRRDAEIAYLEYIHVEWKSRERGVGTWMLSNFLTHVKNKRPQLDAVYLRAAGRKDQISRRMYEKVGFEQLKNEQGPLFNLLFSMEMSQSRVRWSITAVLVQFTVDIIIPSIALLVNTVACDTARRLLASPPLNTRKPPPSGIIYRDALPGEFGTNAGPEDQSKYFVAVNTTNLNKTIGYIGYSVLPGDRAQKELDFFPLPHIRRDAEIVFVEYIRVGWKSRERGVGTWMLSNFLTHV